MAEITGYVMKTKEKNVTIKDGVISRTKRGGYYIQGNDGKGNKMAKILNEATALGAIESGNAKKNF